MRSGALQLGCVATHRELSREDIEQLAAEFRERHGLRLPALLSPDLVRVIVPRLAKATFTEAVNEGVGTDEYMPANAVSHGLHLAANDAAFLDVIRTITDSADIRRFDGRVYRMVPGAGHALDWHDDLHNGPRVGMSINFTAEPFDGGLFQWREASGRMLGEFRNTGLGDAVLFRVAPGLEHRVTEVVGRVPRTAFAGWFRIGAPYIGILPTSVDPAI